MEWAAGAVHALYVAWSLGAAGYGADAALLAGVLGVLLLLAVPARVRARQSCAAPLWTAAAVPPGALALPLCLAALLARHPHALADLLCTTTLHARALAAHARTGLACAAALALARRGLAATAPRAPRVAPALWLGMLGPLAASALAAGVLGVPVGVAGVGAGTFFAVVAVLACGVGDASFGLGDCVAVAHVAAAVVAHAVCHRGWTLSAEAAACLAVAAATVLFAVLCAAWVCRAHSTPRVRVVRLALAAAVAALAAHAGFAPHGSLVRWTLAMLFVEHAHDAVGTRRLALLALYVVVLVLGFAVLHLGISGGCCSECYEGDNSDESESDTDEETEEDKEGKDKEDDKKEKTNGDGPVNPLWRKYFHVLALAMFVPGLLVEPTMVAVPVALVACAFAALEGARAACPAALARVTRFYRLFAGAQDAGAVTATHVALLAGTVLPCWLARCAGVRLPSLAPASGLVAVGVGDAAAAVCGRLCGTHRWPLGPRARRTVEGTLGGTAAAALFVLLLCVCAGDPAPLADPALWLALAGTMLHEACITQIDNLVLPLHFFAVLVAPLPLHL